MQENSARPLALSLTILGGMARFAQNLNFAPVGALSLFAGARLRGWQAYLLPIALMAVTDPFRGGYSFATPFVYASFLINVWIGSRLRTTESPLKIASAALIGSAQFFLLSNFAMWVAPHGLYGHSFGGLVTCYIAAIPFFRNTLLADVLFTAVIFGLHALLSRMVVRSERVAVQTA